MKFYLVAQDKDGKQYVKYAEATTRIVAENAIVAQCRESELNYDLNQLRIEKSSSRQDKTNTKFYLERRRTGRNGKSFEKAL